MKFSKKKHDPAHAHVCELQPTKGKIYCGMKHPNVSLNKYTPVYPHESYHDSRLSLFPHRGCTPLHTPHYLQYNGINFLKDSGMNKDCQLAAMC